jgi:hypothetical protein
MRPAQMIEHDRVCRVQLGRGPPFASRLFPVVDIPKKFGAPILYGQIVWILSLELGIEPPQRVLLV